jgi:CIC family chloride channel protein
MRGLIGLRDLLLGLDLKASGKWFLLSAVIGVVAGLGAVAFQAASQTVMHFTLTGIGGYAPLEPAGEQPLFTRPEVDLSLWRIVAVVAVGGLVSGFIVYTFAPEAEGHGTDAAIEAFHHKRGFIRARVPLIKMVLSAITIGTGGSGGREGPIAQIGAGFGSFLATKLRLSARDRRIMLAAGMGAGVGSIFRAPLAGALFSAEILYRDDLESDVIVPSAIASIVGYSVFSLFLPADSQFVPLFGNHLHYALASPIELVPLALLSIVLVLGGVLYIDDHHGFGDDGRLQAALADDVGLDAVLSDVPPLDAVRQAASFPARFAGSSRRFSDRRPRRDPRPRCASQAAADGLRIADPRRSPAARPRDAAELLPRGGCGESTCRNLLGR